MKVSELLNEGKDVATDKSQFQITDLGDGKFKVKAVTSGGVPIKVIRSMIFFKDSAGNDYEGDDSFNKFAKIGDALINKLETFTLAGKPSKYDFNFKGNGLIVKGKKEDIEKLLNAAIEYRNDEAKRQSDYKATAPERQKESAKLSAQQQKKRKEELYAKYGKKAVESVKIKQIGGDDGYQYNVLVNGRSIMNGLTKREAVYQQEKEWKRLSKEYNK